MIIERRSKWIRSTAYYYGSDAVGYFGIVFIVVVLQPAAAATIFLKTTIIKSQSNLIFPNSQTSAPIVTTVFGNYLLLKLRDQILQAFETSDRIINYYALSGTAYCSPIRRYCNMVMHHKPVYTHTHIQAHSQLGTIDHTNNKMRFILSPEFILREKSVSNTLFVCR